MIRAKLLPHPSILHSVIWISLGTIDPCARLWKMGLVMFAAIMASNPVWASQPADLCREAAGMAAVEQGVPESVLLAITLTETGRNVDGRLEPWPWTVNADGEGHWFPDRDTAIRFAEDLLRRGQGSFDVGCFQINHRWHGDRFGSVASMFDPAANARHAAQFLAELARERNGWSSAAGAYHSRTPAFAERYRARFDAILEGLDPAGTSDVPAPLASPRSPPPVARYQHPLLQARDAPRTPGSLVPLVQVPAI